MKPVYKWFLFSLLGMFIIEIILLVFTIFAEKSWWWVGAPAIFFGICILIFLVVFLGIFIGSRNTPIIEAKPKEIKAQVIDEMKRDEDDPDNFRIKKEGVGMFGDKKEPTPILILNGYGTEKQEPICILINLNNPQRRDILKGNDVTKENIIQSAERLSDHLSEYAIRKSTTTMDIFSRPITTIEELNPVERKVKEEKKEEKPTGEVNVQ